MALSRLVAALADQIAAEVPGAPPVGSAAPRNPGDLPRVTVSVEAATTSMRSIGEVPGPVQVGALRVEVTLDLADPVLHLPSEDVDLLSGDRRVLQLPHGSVVRADGDGATPFAPGDLLVRLGATTFTPVHVAPAAGQVRLDVPAGTLTFPSALPATGQLQLGYFIGAWEVRVERFAATAHLDVAAANEAALAALVPLVESALAPDRIAPERGIRRIDAVALSSSTGALANNDTTRRQRLSYAVDFELIEPIIPSSGGPIQRIEVSINPFGEQFTISREASQP